MSEEHQRRAALVCPVASCPHERGRAPLCDRHWRHVGLITRFDLATAPKLRQQEKWQQLWAQALDEARAGAAADELQGDLFGSAS